jgi:hypothetical protein
MPIIIEQWRPNFFIRRVSYTGISCSHIKCSLAIYYTKVALQMRTTLHSKPVYISLIVENRSGSRCHVAHIYNYTKKKTVYTFVFFFILLNNIAVRTKHLGGPDVALGPQFGWSCCCWWYYKEVM